MVGVVLSRCGEGGSWVWKSAPQSPWRSPRCGTHTATPRDSAQTGPLSLLSNVTNLADVGPTSRIIADLQKRAPLLES